MKICERCGEHNSDGSLFCSACGHVLEIVIPTPPAFTNQPQAAVRPADSRRQKGRGVARKILLAAVIALAVLCALFFSAKIFHSLRLFSLIESERGSALSGTTLVTDAAGQAHESESTLPTVSEAISESDAESESAAAKDEDETKAEPTQAAPPEEPQISAQKLFSKSGVTVKVKRIDYSGQYGAGLVITAENSGKKSYIIQAEEMSVNGYMVDCMFSCDIAAGKKANDTIELSESDLENAGISTIKQLEFRLRLIDSKSYETVAESEVITLKTKGTENYVQPIDDSGIEVYEDKNVKIVAKKLDRDGGIFGSELYFYIENKSSRSLTVQAEDVSVNGFMFNPSFSCEISAGKRAIDEMTFFSSELEENEIEGFEQVELKFTVFRTSDYETITETKAITIKF